MSNGSKELVGKNVYINKIQNSTVGAFCAIFRSNEDVNSEYVRYLFKSEQYISEIKDRLAGTSINNLKNSDIESLVFKFPPKSEQQKLLRF